MYQNLNKQTAKKISKAGWEGGSVGKNIYSINMKTRVQIPTAV